jgi:uncharacterized protein YfdQ (DUF2303 family)
MDATNTQAAIDAGIALGSARSVTDRNQFVLTPEGASVERLEFESDTPARPQGVVTLFDAPSFINYVTPFSGEFEAHGVARLYADKERGTVTAVLNDHATGDQGGFGDNRAVLGLRLTPEWKAWAGLDNKPMSQVDFARFIEDHIPEIVTPTGAELFEIVKSLEGTKGAAFKSGIRLDNGQVQLKYEETVAAKAGEKGDMEIPAEFALGLSPYEGTDPYKVMARFRYRIGDSGALTLFYTLDKPQKVLDSAFADVVKAIEAGLPDTPMHYGVPREYRGNKH